MVLYYCMWSKFFFDLTIYISYISQFTAMTFIFSYIQMKNFVNFQKTYILRLHELLFLLEHCYI